MTEWKNGYKEARERLETHLDENIRFDARDRQALRYLLNLMDEMKKELGFQHEWIDEHDPHENYPRECRLFKELDS